MRLANVVSVGGKAALLVSFACLNFAFADTLNYFYGYSTPNFGVYQSSDAFGSQNVSLAPQVPMVTVQSQNQTSTFGSTAPSIFAQAATASASASPSSGYSVLVQTYGYSVPATQGSYVSGSSSAWGSTLPTMAGYSAPVAIASASTYSPSATPQSVYGYSTSSYYGNYTLPSGWGSGSSYSAPSIAVAPVTVGSSTSGTAFGLSFFGATTTPVATSETGVGIGLGVFLSPRYDSLIAVAPVAVSSPVNVTLGPTTPQMYIGTMANPEPGTVGLFSAGLALLLLKLRRRS
jgi:hypothetical protein